MKNRVGALGLFLFAIYLLTASGHTYSPDEESVLYVTHSFITKGEFDIPNPAVYPVTGGERGLGGKIYAGQGLAQSIIVIPFYVIADRIADAFDSHYHAFILRLVIVSVFDAIVSALTGILLYAWLRRLGITLRVSLALVLVWGLATMAWIYARTFTIEPLLGFWFLLGVYALRAFHDTRSRAWMTVAGLAAGLAALTKIQGVLAFPAMGLYFGALEFKRDLRGFIAANFLPGLFFILGLGLGLGLTGYFNFIRFGDPLQAGYGQIASFPILTGLYGLLLSTGKGIFVYAPPAILFLVALPRFVKRNLAEALLCVTLIATVLIFHARVYFWHGDGSWGPRYLEPGLPFWLLPAGVVLSEWWRSATRRTVVVALVAAGLAVNMLALTINYDTYLQFPIDDDLRHFQLDASPVLGHWRILAERVNNLWDGLFASRDGVIPIRGFLATGDEEFLPRYLAPRATLLVKSSSAEPLQLSLVANDYRPEQRAKRTLEFASQGVSLEAQHLPATDSGVLNYHAFIPASRSTWAPVDIVTVGSERKGTSPLGDELGVHLQSLEVRANGRSLAARTDLAIPPLPVADPMAMWGWFFQPAHPQFDFYWWYLYFTGIEDGPVVAIVATFSLIGIACLLLSAPTIVRDLRPRVSKVQETESLMRLSKDPSLPAE